MAETGTEREVPEGYKLEWVPDTDWSVGGRYRECSFKHCHDLAVASFCRPVWRNGSKGSRRYYYCVSHLYGRKIEDGVVKFGRLVKIEEVAEIIDSEAEHAAAAEPISQGNEYLLELIDILARPIQDGGEGMADNQDSPLMRLREKILNERRPRAGD